MATDLLDLKRLKLTALTKKWLKAKVQANPRTTEQEVARDALHALAARDFREAKMLVALALDEDLSGDEEGRRR